MQGTNPPTEINPSPTFIGAWSVLRPLRADDFAELCAVADAAPVWEQHPAQEPYQKVVFREFFGEALEAGGALIASVVATEQVIGSARVHSYASARSEIEIGWTFLMRSHWGASTNYEMKELMVRHAFRFVRSVIFVVDAQNRNACRAAEKVGSIDTGKRPYRTGRENVVHSITEAASERMPPYHERVRWRMAMFRIRRESLRDRPCH